MMCLSLYSREIAEITSNNTSIEGTQRGILRKGLCIAVAVFVAFAALYVGATSVLCGMLAEAQWCEPLPRISLQSIEDAIIRSGPWGVVVSIGLMMLHSLVPFPAEFITIVNGMVWGPLWGLVITWVGAMMGAFLAFGLARMLGQPFVQRMLRQKHAGSFQQWLDHHGGGAVFISRFIPIISFNLINYAAGLTRISWWTFAWATGLGILPITILMVVLGSRIQTMSWWGWTYFLLLGFALWGLGHLLHKRFTKPAIAERDTDSR